MQTSQKHVEINMQDIPQDIMDKHGYITFVIDLMSFAVSHWL